MSSPHILMSPPDHFEVAYAINPWMSAAGGVDRDQALRQWERLHEELGKRARLSLLPAVRGLPDLVFTANAAFVRDRLAITAHYKHPERQGEEPHVERWFAEAGYEVVRPHPVKFEGAGDALVHGDRVLAGYRLRTDIAAHRLITERTGLPVLALELAEPHFYHIDVCACPLEDGSVIYYPGAFDEYGLRVIEANVAEDKRLLVTLAEARQFACNAVNVGDAIFLNQGSDRLVGLLRERGFEVVEVDLSEFIKAGGSAKCLTLRLS